MRRIDDIIVPIVARGGAIRVVGNALRFEVPGGLLPGEPEALKESKAAIVSALSHGLYVVGLPDGSAKVANPPPLADVLAACRAEGWDMCGDLEDKVAA